MNLVTQSSVVAVGGVVKRASTATANRDVRPGQQVTRSDFTSLGADRGVTDRATCTTPIVVAPVPVIVASRVIRKGTQGQVVYATRLGKLQTSSRPA